MTSGFKLIYAPRFTKLVLDWFKNKFMVIYRADSMQLMKRFADPQKKTIYVEQTTKQAGRGRWDCGYVTGRDQCGDQRCKKRGIDEKALDTELPDPKDMIFYEIIMEKRKTDEAFLVTGNVRHFPVEPFIVTPREMLAIIELS